MKRGRKKRLAPRFPTYCGQTTPTVRMSVIVSRRTRVNQSSHSPVAKLLSIARPRLYPGIPKSKQAWRKAERKVAALREEDHAERTDARLVRAAQLADQGEERQVHGNDHAANDNTKENDHDRFKGCQEVLNCRVDLFFVKVRNLLEHRVHRTRLFADGDHLCDHARKYFGISQRLGERLTFFERFSHLLQSPFDDCVSSRLGGNVKTFEDGHTAGDQRTKGTCKPRHGNLSHQNAKDWQLKDDGIEYEAPLRSAIPGFQTKESGSQG